MAAAFAPGKTRAWLCRCVVATGSAAIATYVLFGYGHTAPLVIAPAIAGIMAALIGRDLVPTVGSAAVGGLVGGLAAASDFTARVLEGALGAMPAWANPDVLTDQVYRDLMRPLLMPAVQTGRSVGVGGVALVMALLTPLCAAGCLWVLRRASDGERARGVAGWLFVSALIVVFISSSWTSTATFRSKLGQGMQDGRYGYDAAIYQRAYEGMLKGRDYYGSLVRAAAGDVRLREENAVRDGKFYGFITSPTLARQPWVFYAWRIAAPQGATGVYLLALLACSLAMMAMHWGLKRDSFEASLLAPLLIMPMLLFAAGWRNIFLPDLWAGVLMLLSLAFLVRENVIGSALLALAAALCRETLVFWLMAVGAFALARSRSSKSGQRDLAWAGGSFVAFVALYALHYVQAGRIIAAQANSGLAGFLTRLQASAAAPLAFKFLAPFAYMMWPYGFFRFPSAALVVLGLAGWALSFPGRPALKWTTFGYGAFWFVFYSTIGAASSYWGQQVLPFYLVGLAMLIALPIRLGAERDAELR